MERLLCIISSLDVGGAETFMMKMFRALPQKYKIDFIVSADTGYYENEVKKLGGNIYRIPMRTKNPIKACMGIYWIVKKNKYKSVIKLCDTPIGVFDLISARIGGAKRVTVRSCNANSNESRIRHLINGALRPVFNYCCDVKIAPSRLAAEYTFGKREVEHGTIIYLHNALDTSVYKYDINERNRIRAELGIDDNEIVIGHIGRFNKQKNHEFLIRVFDALQKNMSRVKLLLIGDGELVDIIKTLVIELGIDNIVLFLGVRSDIPSILSAIDMLLLPSFYEGMPNTVIEAQAEGLPCVVSDTITREANITGLVHYLSLNAGIEKWVEIIGQSVGNRLTDTSKDFISNGYDIESVVKTFINTVYC